MGTSLPHEELDFLLDPKAGRLLADLEEFARLYTELSPSAQTAYAQLLDAALLDYLARYRPDPLDEAVGDAVSRGTGWASRLRRGTANLAKRFPAHAASTHLP